MRAEPMRAEPRRLGKVLCFRDTRCRPKLSVDASALYAAADGPLATHPAQAVGAVSPRKAVAAHQMILFVRALAVAETPALGFLQCSAGFTQAGRARSW